MLLNSEIKEESNGSSIQSHDYVAVNRESKKIVNLKSKSSLSLSLASDSKKSSIDDIQN